MTDPSDIRQSSISSTPNNQKTVSVSFNRRSIFKYLLVIVVVLVAFWLGAIYGKHHAAKSSTALSSTYGNTGGFGGGYGHGGGGFGTVSAISASSITVDNSRSGTSKTYAITSSTKITDNGQSSSVSAIADGDTAIVMPSSSDSSDAASIIINPNFGGNGSGSTGSSTSGSSTGSSTGSGTTQ